ncbi:hypothetical protein [Janibacter limosus]|uniref:hypothetical protein n=1 Tax=Janibacter limosus TaxID=53458 RepID=UPI000AC52F88|nr:hypothetical protein [Janibacter limosus]
MTSPTDGQPMRLRCGRCGSSASHQIVMGMPPLELAEQVAATPWQRLGGCLIVPGTWTAECLTCGQRETVDGGPADFTATPAPDRTVARAITGYAARCREQLDQTTTSVVSHAGLWLFLASAAEHSTGEGRATLEEILGMPLEEAGAAARRLLAAPHSTLAAAAGAWAAADAVTPVGVERPIPDQASLDAWAAERTRGLIDRFPLEVTELTRIVLTTALVLEPMWTEPLVADGAWLRLTGGLQTIVETQAAGPVIVAKPHSEDGIDVVSVRAHPRTKPAQVWQAVDEVVALLDDGGLWHAERPGDLQASGFGWRVRTARVQMTEDERSGLPTDAMGRPQQWRSRVPAWAAQETLDLTGAPGVAGVAAAILPEEPDAVTRCVQTVRAEYDADGFRVAALTALDMVGSMPPQLSRVEVERVELDFRAPHAVVAVARGGAWEGVPLVSAWVGGANHGDSDWEALELLADTDPQEAAGLRGYKEQQMRSRGELPSV